MPQSQICVNNCKFLELYPLKAFQKTSTAQQKQDTYVVTWKNQNLKQKLVLEAFKYAILLQLICTFLISFEANNCIC